jgi:hypothetical protein
MATFCYRNSFEPRAIAASEMFFAKRPFQRASEQQVSFRAEIQSLAARVSSLMV